MKHTYPHILTSRTHFYSPCDAAIRAYVNSSISAVSPGDYSSAFTLRKLAEPPNASLPRALTGLFQGSLTRRALSTTCHAANLQIRGLCHVPAHETTRTRSESTGTSRQSPVLHLPTYLVPRPPHLVDTHMKRAFRVGNKTRMSVALSRKRFESTPAGSPYATGACHSVTWHPGELHTEYL
jgi:hypothetical protein